MPLPRFNKGRGKLSANVLNRVMDVVKWWEQSEGLIQYKQAKHYEPRRNSRGGVIPVWFTEAIPINGAGDRTTQWEYEFVEVETADGVVWDVKDGGLVSDGSTVLHARNLAEAGNAVRPLAGTVAVSNGVTVGVEFPSISTVTTWLLPIRLNRPVWVRYYGGRHWFDAGNDTDSTVTCNE